MSEVRWTMKELERFDELVDMVSDRHQVTRITGRMEMDKFIKEHGKEKCDAMWEYLEGQS